MYSKTLRRAAGALALCALIFAGQCDRAPSPYGPIPHHKCRGVSGEKVCG